ncbi:MAG: type I phosphomannose isomerase catalytic subunit, partial [Sphingomonadales bacterium]
MNAIGTLSGVVKHYDWGGRQFIAGLLSQTNSEEKPFAEYWMGTH